MSGRVQDGATLERGEGGWFVVVCGWESTDDGSCWRFRDVTGPIPNVDSALYVLRSYMEWGAWRESGDSFSSTFTSSNTF